MNRSRAKILSVAFVLLATLSITGPAVAANGRPFIWPTTGRITQPYGCTGFTGGKLQSLAHHNFHVPLDDMGIVESIHLTAFHWVVDNLYARIGLEMK